MTGLFRQLVYGLGLVKAISTAPEGARGYKALLRAHTRGERLRRELFHCWYAEPMADAPLLTESTDVHVSPPIR
jgi:hypothetical protein